MKNLFIDCGTNLGQGLREFHEKFNLFNNPNWDIYTFEPNEHIDLDNMFLNVKNIVKVKKAVWINNEKLEFICKGKIHENDRKKYNEERFQGGGSQLKQTQIINNNQENFTETKKIIVDTIDFKKFLKEKSIEYDKICVKMDIEGAEFQIIDDLIKTDNLQLIDMLFVEMHARFNFKRSEWLIKKNEINKIEDTFIQNCKKHVKNVYKWS